MKRFSFTQNTMSFLLIVLVFSIPLSAQDDLISLRDVFKRPFIEGERPSNGSFSPDGEWVVYRWKDVENDSVFALYKVAVNGGESTKVIRPFRGRFSWFEGEKATLVAVEKGTLKAFDLTNGNDREIIKSKKLGSFTFSPDNSSLAFTDDKGLWVANSNGSDKKQITLVSVSSVRWTEGNDRIFYVQDNNIWYADRVTGSVQKVTDRTNEAPRGGFYFRSGVSSYNISPDGKYVSFTDFKSNSEEREIIVPHYVSDKKYVWPQPARNSFPDDPAGETTLYVVDVEKQKSEAVDLGLGKNFRIWSRDWNGSKMFVSLLTSDNHDRYHLVLDAKKLSVSIIDREHDDTWIGGPDYFSGWDKDGKNIFFTSERSGFNHLWKVSAKGGTPVQLTSGDWELENVNSIEDKTKFIYQSTEVDPAERHIYVYDLKKDRAEMITASVGMSDIQDVTKDGAMVLYSHASTLTPADYYTAPVKGNAKETQITNSIPAEFHKIDWVEPEFVWFKNSKDGKSIYATRYDPPNMDKTKKYPAVVFVHGAGYIQNTIKGWATYSPNIKFHTRLAQKGYVVLDLDYRGSQGYGRDFRTDVYMYLGGKDLEDEVAGVDYLKTLDYVDTDYVGIYGGSYGGFMTLMALFLEPDVYKAGAALRSVTDWENYNAGYTQQRLGLISENKKAYIKSSPIHHGAGLKGHLLLMHGLIDDNVFAQDSFQMVEALIELGKTDLFESVFYPTQRHGFTDPESWIDEYRRIELLFDRYLMEAMGGKVIDDKK